jgi:hypothetical protein
LTDLTVPQRLSYQALASKNYIRLILDKITGSVRSFVSKQTRQKKTQTEDMSYANPNGNYQS